MNDRRNYIATPRAHGRGWPGRAGAGKRAAGMPGRGDPMADARELDDLRLRAREQGEADFAAWIRTGAAIA